MKRNDNFNFITKEDEEFGFNAEFLGYIPTGYSKVPGEEKDRDFWKGGSLYSEMACMPSEL